MKIKQYCDGTKKEFIYDIYCNVIENRKDYDKITRTKIFYEIIKYLENNALENLITYDEYKPLYHLLENKNYKYEEKAYRKLFSRGLCVFDYYNNQYVVLEEMVTILSSKIKEINLTFLKQRKLQDQIIVGIIKAYGLLSINHFQDCLFHYFDRNLCLRHFIETDYYRQFYDTTLLEDNIILDKRFEFEVDKLYRAYHVNEGIILNHDSFLSVETLKSIYEYDIDINIRANKQLLKEIEPLSCFDQEYIIKKLQLYCHVQAVIDDSFFSAIYYYKFKNLLPYIKKAALYIPCAIFHGLSEKQYLQKYRNKSNEIGARLSDEDASLFYETYLALLEYTNNQYKIVPKRKKIYRQKDIPLEELHEIREYMIKNPKVVDEFIQKNPYHFNQNELSITHNYKYCMLDTFFIMNYDSNFTYLLGRNGNFAIKDLYDEIQSLVPPFLLPHMVVMNIIPFKGMIIYDGILMSYPMQHSIDDADELLENFQKNTIYYSISTNKILT